MACLRRGRGGSCLAQSLKDGAAIFGYRNAYIYPERVFLPQITGLLDATGRLKDPEQPDRLRKQAGGFVDFVERLQNVKLRGTKA
jgi:hypothetical protein